jgi:hypothetical protein
LAEQNREFLQTFYPDGKAPMYAVQSVVPRLNTLGAQGWELIEMRPATVGKNGDILISAPDARFWTNVYLCSFKRRKVY